MPRSMPEKMVRAMNTSLPWHMAVASYSYSRAHGLSVREAFMGGWELYWEYRKKNRTATEGR